ncbi:tyrosinase [Penicillium argentinense]|uniref:tyrosinase n=1 Tax=Penicillium argentinense TaxID=1131581 RepID=A0A9W9EVY9_9EURO|nr:tyrosinase [Penicillium argentinense]KAJ5088929.1 tyrosinase [Penicillium argentinense]
MKINNKYTTTPRHEEYYVKGATGGKDPNGEIPARRNIHDLYKSYPNQWQLYLLALRKWYDQPADQLKSYFQIAGIHGMPYRPWNEDPTQKIGSGQTIGYCTHTTVLFPSWHRPYLVLYEQRMQEVMRESILPGIPASERDKWEKEIDLFRIPYWDWAKPTPPVGGMSKEEERKVAQAWLPPSSWKQTVDITIPGHQGSIDNPLYTFVVPGGKRMADYGVGNIKTDDPDFVPYGESAGLSRCPEYKYFNRVTYDDPDDGYDGPQFTAQGEETKEYKESQQYKKEHQDYLTKYLATLDPKREVKDTADWPKKWRDGEIRNEMVYTYFQTLPWATLLPPTNKKEDQEKFTKFNKNHRAAENIYRLFSYTANYDNFATAGGIPDISGGKLPEGQWYQSLEQIHNSVHWWVGGVNNGHMAQVPVASFDPFFWLHHANIERFYCLWQFLHPEEWFVKRHEPMADTTGALIDEQGNHVQDKEKAAKRWIGPETELHPFKKDATTYLTSDLVRHHNNFNYTYPELQKRGRSDGQIKQDVWAEINETYSPYRKELLGNDRDEDMEVVVNIEYNKYLFHGKPYAIKLYLMRGDKKDPSNEEISEMFNFSAPGVVAGKVVCSNCVRQEQSEMKCRAQMTITHLKPYFQMIDPRLNINDGKAIETFLKKRLYSIIWATSGRPLGCQLGDNSEKDPIRISVAATTATYNKDPTKQTTFNPFKTFESLAGSIADLLVVPPGALILSVTGSAIGVLNASGEVVDFTGKIVSKSLGDLTGIVNKDFGDMVEAFGGSLTTLATGVTGGTAGILGGITSADSSKKNDDKGSGGRGGGIFGGGGLF